MAGWKKVLDFCRRIAYHEGMIKRTLALLLLLLTCSACTPEEVRFWSWYNAGQPAEDDPAWDCHTMGNGLCGPGHAGPHPADEVFCIGPDMCGTQEEFVGIEGMPVP